MVFSKDLNYFFSPIPQTLFRIHRAAERRQPLRRVAGHPEEAPVALPPSDPPVAADVQRKTALRMSIRNPKPR